LPTAEFAVGSTTSATITVAPSSVGRITIAPVVTTDEVDLTPADNRLVQPTTVALVSNFDNSPQIAIASNAPAVPYLGVDFRFGLTSAVYVVSATVSNIQHARRTILTCCCEPFRTERPLDVGCRRKCECV